MAKVASYIMMKSRGPGNPCMPLVLCAWQDGCLGTGTVMPIRRYLGMVSVLPHERSSRPCVPSCCLPVCQAYRVHVDMQHTKGSAVRRPLQTPAAWRS